MLYFLSHDGTEGIGLPLRLASLFLWESRYVSFV